MKSDITVPNTIISQTYVDGKVTFTIPLVRCPDFTDGNYTVDEIYDYANLNGIDIEVIYQANTTVENGTIFSQSKSVGDVVKEVDILKIRIARYPLME